MEATFLSLELNDDLMLLDNLDTRDLAKKKGLQVMGTLGGVALAKYRGLIREAKPVIDKLVQNGFWILR